MRLCVNADSLEKENKKEGILCQQNLFYFFQEMEFIWLTFAK